MTEKTALDRDILIEWYHNKDASDEEIAEAVGSTASHVGEVKDTFADYDDFQATLDEEERTFEERTGMTVKDLLPHLEDKDALQRDVLIEWYHNKEASDEEIADAVGCSETYVSTVKAKFEGYSDFQVALEEGKRSFEERTGIKPEDLKSRM